jgi:hypothetical protein
MNEYLMNFNENMELLLLQTAAVRAQPVNRRKPRNKKAPMVSKREVIYCDSFIFTYSFTFYIFLFLSALPLPFTFASSFIVRWQRAIFWLNLASLVYKGFFLHF